MIDVILLFAGKGERFSNTLPKQFTPLLGKEMFLYPFETFLKVEEIERIFLVTDADHITHVNEIISTYTTDKKIFVVAGGITRQESSFKGLQAISNTMSYDKVIIHDAARPLIDVATIKNLISVLETKKAITTYMPIFDSIVSLNNESKLSNYENRENFIKIQTPQAFDFDIIFSSHFAAINNDIVNATDDAQLAFLNNQEITLVRGNEQNFKVTTAFDLKVIEGILKNNEF